MFHFLIIYVYIFDLEHIDTNNIYKVAEVLSRYRIYITSHFCILKISDISKYEKRVVVNQLETFYILFMFQDIGLNRAE